MHHSHASFTIPVQSGPYCPQPKTADTSIISVKLKIAVYYYRHYYYYNCIRIIAVAGEFVKVMDLDGITENDSSVNLFLCIQYIIISIIIIAVKLHQYCYQGCTCAC